MTQPSALSEVGDHIRNLRKKRGLTGEQLGALVGLSQSKIAKIEHGYSPMPRDIVERLLDALQAPRTIVLRVDLLLSSDSEELKTFQLTPYTMSWSTIAKSEQVTKHIRTVVLCAVPMLLQTPAYRLGLLKRIGISEADVNKQLRAVQERQDCLWDPERQASFIMLEHGLYSLRTTVAEHLLQLDRLERMATIQNIQIGIIPLEAGLPIPSVANFTIHDKRIVWHEIGFNDTSDTDPGVILQHVNEFNELRSIANYDADARQLIRKAMHYFSGAVEK